jgi:hypothetical protein
VDTVVDSRLQTEGVVGTSPWRLKERHSGFGLIISAQRRCWLHSKEDSAGQPIGRHL